MIGRGIVAFIRRFGGGFGGLAQGVIRFTVVLYLLDGAVSHDILRKPAIKGTQLSYKETSCGEAARHLSLTYL